jgi:hypothetical protein
MTIQHLPRLSAMLIAAAALLAACGSSDHSSTLTANPTATQAAVSSTATASAPAAKSTTPPASVPPIPSGSYRMSLTADAVQAGGGYDMGSVGTWTLTIKHGTYTLACRWIDTSGGNCGDSRHPDGDLIVETGPVRGDAKTLWLASDLAAVAKLNGCKPGECGVPDPYQFGWKLDGTDLVLSDFVGFGRNAGLDLYHNFTLAHWKHVS